MPWASPAMALTSVRASWSADSNLSTMGFLRSRWLPSHSVFLVCVLPGSLALWPYATSLICAQAIGKPRSFWAGLISLSGPDLEIVTVNCNLDLGSSFSPWCIYVSDFPFLNLLCLRLLSKGHLTSWPRVHFLVLRMRQLD